MTEAVGAGLVAECYWPGVRPGDLRELDERVEACVAELVRGGQPVRYVGSMLMVEDEVVLCLFEGTAVAVRRAAERAGIPFGRILRTVRGPGAGPGEAHRAGEPGRRPGRWHRGRAGGDARRSIVDRQEDRTDGGARCEEERATR
jgi:hypothetical protein